MRRFTPTQHAIFWKVVKSKDQQLDILVTSQDWRLRQRWAVKGNSPKELNAARALVRMGYLELLKEDVYEHRFHLPSTGDPDTRTEARFGIGPKGLEYLNKLNEAGHG